MLGWFTRCSCLCLTSISLFPSLYSTPASAASFVVYEYGCEKASLSGQSKVINPGSQKWEFHTTRQFNQWLAMREECLLFSTFRSCLVEHRTSNNCRTTTYYVAWRSLVVYCCVPDSVTWLLRFIINGSLNTTHRVSNEFQAYNTVVIRIRAISCPKRGGILQDRRVKTKRK